MDEIDPDSGHRVATERDPSRRRLQAALGLSTLLHLALVVSIGNSGSWQSVSSRAAVLTVRLEQGADPAPRAETEPPSATDLARHVTALAPAAETAHRAVPPAALPSAHEPTIATGALTGDDRLAEVPALLVTVGETGLTVDIDTAIPSAEAEPPPVPPEAVVQRVGEWIHELKSTDPRRAELSWQQDGRPYTAVVTRRTAGDATDLERYDVEIVTPAESGRWMTGLSYRRLAFSRYCQFVDHWDENIQLHDDEIAGRFHTNSSLIIGYDRKAAPRFRGKVTTAGRGFRIADSFGRRRREDIFQGGLETGVERIELPRQRDLALEQSRHTGGYRRQFERDTRIRFHADGSFGWSELQRRSAWRTESPEDGPVFLVGGPGAELRVSGIVRGQVLVYSPERIVIEGSLRYARDPRVDSDADDMLGLVSEGRVEIAPPYVTGRGDLDIHAAIYALRRFVVTHTEAPLAGTLRIFGSLTAGTLSETEPRYATKIEFDPRLEARRPPGFPVSPRFELETADAAWRLEDVSTPD